MEALSQCMACVEMGSGRPCLHATSAHQEKKNTRNAMWTVVTFTVLFNVFTNVVVKIGLS